jgi:O-antigen ligase
MLIFSMLATTSGEDFLQQKIFSKITKSGSVEELSSGTGRNVIWSYTWSLIQQRPILGYGAGTSKDLLAEYSLYTHNMFLNVALSAGLIAGFGLMMLVLYGLLRTLYNAAPVPDCILVFLAINGLTENVVFENIASGSTALLMLTLAWHLLPEEYQGEPISPTLNVS